MLVIGIVGPPAGGKSTVAAMLAERGAVWVNADRLAHGAMRLKDVKQQMPNFFGNTVFNVAGELDRREIAKRVFGANPTQREALEYIESVLHPVVFELATRKIRRVHNAEPQRVCVLDAPLLIEAGWHLMCDEIWYLDSSLQSRCEWIENRGWNEEQLKQRETQQLSLVLKMQHSSCTINNHGDTDDLRLQVSQAWETLLAKGIANSHHC